MGEIWFISVLFSYGKTVLNAGIKYFGLLIEDEYVTFLMLRQLRVCSNLDISNSFVMPNLLHFENTLMQEFARPACCSHNYHTFKKKIKYEK